MFKMGSVGTCLSKAVAGGTQLTEGCKALVLVRLAEEEAPPPAGVSIE